MVACMNAVAYYHRDAHGSKDSLRTLVETLYFDIDILSQTSAYFDNSVCSHRCLVFFTAGPEAYETAPGPAAP